MLLGCSNWSKFLPAIPAQHSLPMWGRASLQPVKQRVSGLLLQVKSTSEKVLLLLAGRACCTHSKAHAVEGEQQLLLCEVQNIPIRCPGAAVAWLCYRRVHAPSSRYSHCRADVANSETSIPSSIRHDAIHFATQIWTGRTGCARAAVFKQPQPKAAKCANSRLPFWHICFAHVHGHE